MASKHMIPKAAALVIAMSVFASGAIGQTTRAKVLLELFTSQGCSSCPPADALLESYTARDDVIALSLPVDYWDRLGWKDTYASRDYTNRQKDYASARGDQQVYTPQIVVSGMSHVVGSHRSNIDNAVSTAKRSLQDSQVPLSLQMEGETLVVHVGAAPAGAAIAGGRLILAVVQDAGTVAIHRGENASRTVTYRNIVRTLKTIGAWTGTPSTMRLGKSEFFVPGTQSLVVLLQNGIGGPIVNAAQIRIPGQS